MKHRTKFKPNLQEYIGWVARFETHSTGLPKAYILAPIVFWKDAEVGGALESQGWVDIDPHGLDLDEAVPATAFWQFVDYVELEDSDG